MISLSECKGDIIIVTIWNVNEFKQLLKFKYKITEIIKIC